MPSLRGKTEFIWFISFVMGKPVSSLNGYICLTSLFKINFEFSTVVIALDPVLAI